MHKLRAAAQRKLDMSTVPSGAEGIRAIVGPVLEISVATAESAGSVAVVYQ
jgi:hypothetical protein